VDGYGYFITINSYVLDVSKIKLPFKVLKQNGISSSTSAQPTFYPDVTGIFRFDLVVFDGSLYSLPSLTIINVVESVVPRGCIPDLSFLWGYISDFWALVDNKEHITTFWGSLAQIAATELLSLWQVEYNKSLRDIQRTFQRRWLHYDLKILDLLKETSSVRFIYGGVYLQEVPGGGLALAGQTLLISSPVLTQEVHVMFQGVLLSEAEIISQLTSRLKIADTRFDVRLLANTTSGRSQIRIDAPFPFTVYGGTASALLPVSMPANNEEPRGENGLIVGIDTLIVDRDLGNLDILEDDLLVIGNEAYRISRIINNSTTDDWANQRIVVKDPIPAIPASDWYIVGGTTSAFLDFYNAMLSRGDHAQFEVTDVATGRHTQFSMHVLGAASSVVDKLAVDLWPLVQYIYDPKAYEVNLVWVHRRTYMPVDDLVVSVPILQEKIKDSPDEAILRENVDFFVEEYRGSKCLRFVTGVPDVWQGVVPPERMWAEVTYIDNCPVIEANFGIPAEFTLDDLARIGTNLDYLSAVRGMWYSYFYGPTMRNLRVGAQILLGLPFAEEQGTIEEIRSDFSSKQGRILVRDVANKEVVRSYTYPRVLDLEVNPATGTIYKEGDVVNQFEPLVEGVEVVDYVKDPAWFQGCLGQGIFYEVEKYFRFLVRVNSSAFHLNALLFVKSFINKIKPTYTFPKFVVNYAVNEDGDAVDVTDVILSAGTLLLYDDISLRGLGHWMHLDDPNPSGGGWMGRLDDGRPYTPAAVSPTPVHPVVWAIDKSDLIPEDSIYCGTFRSMDGSTYPTLDSIWSLDMPALQDIVPGANKASIDHVPELGQVDDSIVLGESFTAIGSSTISSYVVEVVSLGPNSVDVVVGVWCTVNGVDEPNSLSILTLNAGQASWKIPVSVTPFGLVATDVVQWYLRSNGAEAGVDFYKVLVMVGDFYYWKLDEYPPAGIYDVQRLL
jgi:hypothetical protein